MGVGLGLWLGLGSLVLSCSPGISYIIILQYIIILYYTGRRRLDLETSTILGTYYMLVYCTSVLQHALAFSTINSINPVAYL
jgi:hypothetical protein